jgi:hypothetical protein
MRISRSPHVHDKSICGTLRARWTAEVFTTRLPLSADARVAGSRGLFCSATNQQPQPMALGVVL